MPWRAALLAFSGAMALATAPQLSAQQVTAAATSALEQGCNARQAAACADLGRAYQSSGDLSRAAVAFGRACDLGSGQGCLQLGKMQAKGLGLPADPARAATLYERACTLGESWGCTNLGFAYAAGRGVTKDAAKASDYYRLGCDKGDGLGCANLGSLYDSGQGVVADSAEAVRLFAKACDGGEVLGCKNLGVIHEYGRGVPVDKERALAAYRRVLALTSDPALTAQANRGITRLSGGAKPR